MTVHETTIEKIRSLPADLVQEVRDFTTLSPYGVTIDGGSYGRVS